MTKLHPYSLIFGVGIGIVVFAALRHALFAIFAGIAALVLIDFLIKARARNNIDKDNKK